MAIVKAEIRSGTYYDSAVLMQLQRSLAGLPGVQDAGVVMGTDSNKELLAHINLLSEMVQGAKPDDLVIVVRAEDEKTAAENDFFCITAGKNYRNQQDDYRQQRK